MRGLFNYESKFMQSLLMISDIIILNGLYLLCCIPIVTIGAAQAGLHTAFRVLMDPDDDSSSTAAFLRGFKNGFTVITPVWLLMTVAVFAAAFSCIMSYVFEKAGAFASTILVAAVLIIITMLQTMVPVFHSRFACRRWQLAKNTMLFMFAHPLRCFAAAILMWAPVIVFLFIDFVSFAKLSLLFLIGWYGIAGLFITSLMRKPFKILEEHFYKTHDEDNNSNSSVEETSEA